MSAPAVRVRIPRRVLAAIEATLLFSHATDDDGFGPAGVSFRTKVRQTRVVAADGSILVSLDANELVAAELLAPDTADGRAFIRSIIAAPPLTLAHPLTSVRGCNRPPIRPTTRGAHTMPDHLVPLLHAIRSTAEREAPRGFSGLPVPAIVAQSTICHPDWSLADHVGFLVYEEGLDCTPVLVADVEQHLAALR